MVVHPWYIITILYLGLFTNYNFQIIWSVLIFLTYSAYQNSKVEENFYLIGLEYIIVVGFFIYEFLGQEKIKTFLKEISFLVRILHLPRSKFFLLKFKMDTTSYLITL